MTNIEILANSGKFKKVDDILSNFDLVADMLKEDVARTLSSAGIIATSIDDYFASAARIIKENLSKKRHLNGIKKLLSCENVEQGLKILLSKLRGYTHNQMLKDRKNSVAWWKKRWRNEIETMDTSTDPLELLLQEESEKEELERAEEIKKNEIEKFRKMVEDGEIKARKTKSGHTQLCLSFRERMR